MSSLSSCGMLNVNVTVCSHGDPVMYCENAPWPQFPIPEGWFMGSSPEKLD
jgi:hypothetical protein